MLGRILSFFRQHHLKDSTLTGGISSIKKMDGYVPWFRLLDERLGEFGPYQRKLYLLVCLPAALTATITMARSVYNSTTHPGVALFNL